MPQSSLTAWLTKPTAVKAAPRRVPLEDESPDRELIGTSRLETHNVNSSGPNGEDGQSGDCYLDSVSNASKPTMVTRLRSQPSLPSNVHFRRCNKEDIPQLKRLNSLLLPIPYPESFYREITDDPLTNDITLLATWHDNPSLAVEGHEKGRLIGAIRCRLLATSPAGTQSRADAVAIEKETGGKPMLYLSTLVLLSPYRSHGIASQLLHRLTQQAVDDYGVGSVGAHVWEANVDALEWYRKRGFREVRREKEYYRRLKPTGAVVVRRDVSVMDFIAS